MNKGFIGGVVSIIVAVLTYFGIDVPAEDQQTLLEGLTAVFGAGGVISLGIGWFHSLKNRKNAKGGSTQG